MVYGSRLPGAECRRLRYRRHGLDSQSSSDPGVHTRLWRLCDYPQVAAHVAESVLKSYRAYPIAAAESPVLKAPLQDRTRVRVRRARIIDAARS